MRRAALIVQQIERWILTSAVLAMAANTIVNVFARNLFGQNLAASQELNEFLIIIVCLSMIDMDTYPDPRRNHNEWVMAVQSVATPGTRMKLASNIPACALCRADQ